MTIMLIYILTKMERVRCWLQDITLQSVSVYEDGQILASTSPYNNNGYELSTLGKKGNMSYLADDVSAYLRHWMKKIFCIFQMVIFTFTR